MKTLKLNFTALICIFFSITLNAQEKKIDFNKGTLKICSYKNFNITGYDGKEVIIKSNVKKGSYSVASVYTDDKTQTISGFTSSSSMTTTSSGNSFIVFGEDGNRKKGLKKLGEKNENKELGIHFKIEKKGDVLIFEDFKSGNNNIMLYGNESYEIMLPNSLKLVWKTESCDNDKASQKANVFYNSTPSTLSRFSGEVEIQTTLNNIELTDVTGAVAINSIGGNVTVKFEKEKPENLYSIYSNNGFIDIEIPKNASLFADVTGKSIYSDVEFKILEEKVINDAGQDKNKMVLKYGNGKTKLILDAGYGNVYLRQK